MLIVFGVLSVILCVAEIWAIKKSRRMTEFLAFSVIVLIAAMAMNVVAGLIGNLITGDFHVAAFFMQLFPFATAGIWVIFTLVGAIIKYIKGSKKTRTIVNICLLAIAAVIVGVCVFKEASKVKEIADTKKIYASYYLRNRILQIRTQDQYNCRF